MQKKRADVHAALLHRIGQHCGQRVDHKRNSTENDDGPTHDFGWVNHAHAAFVDQIEADHDEGGVVDQGRDDFDPAIAEGHALIGRTACDLACGEGNDKRGHIGKVVQRIGDQCQTAREYAPNDLRNGK